MQAHKTSAWPLSAVYVALIVYASLYPFSGWRDQGPLPLAFLYAPWPRYWTGFDVISNVLGYAPLGFLLALACLRTGRAAHAMRDATAAAGVLSLLMEMTQSYLPVRVPSNLDFVLNLAGAWAGAVVAVLLEAVGALDRWVQFRARWFVPDARGALVLLALWPVALLFPASVPFGLGQVFERLEAAWADWMLDSPFLGWFPMPEVALQPLFPATEMICVALGMLIPCLLGYCVIPTVWRRAALLGAVFATGLGASLLSAALSYGPSHAWAWVSLPVQTGCLLAAALALGLLRLPARVCAALLLLLLGVYLSLINQAPTSAYFSQTLQTWEQGRFIRFHGLAKWVGWLWPYAVLLYVLTRIWGQKAELATTA